GKMLGQVLGVSLLACVVNPHHVRVFQLPPELAYMLLTLCEPFSIPLPDALVAGGRMLKEMGEGDTTWKIPAVSQAYFWNVSMGKHAVGLAAGPLLVLGLV